ncbi:M20/M25/M40 family metallo-hydrolase [Nocardioides sp. TF02-7]|uniref:M20/M25/M40 family metallo-hydrolase n=1 Tax=Nocardioides sp. TF02-7 TaxID=2917724 RepID=UPI001F065253|nr:M20/M25/M40 family metallo-hydrolase [Nocardioides sp. TF02-7]UMG91463.1 M20/M25/M40 family metallo-hydrolase [Nocardioides sp. TF02-7]
MTETHTAPAAPCADRLQRAVVAGIRATGDDDPVGLWSRAGHDAMAMAGVTDVGMLFLRCHDGISHHPDEDVRELDVARGLDALEHAVLHVARQLEEER